MQNNGQCGRRHNVNDGDVLKQMSETYQVKGSRGYGSYSAGFTWAKGAADASSVLSDGSKSEVSALDPSFEEETYKLNKDRTMDIPVDEYVNRMDKNTTLQKVQYRRLGRSDYFDAGQLCNYRDVYADYQYQEPIEIHQDDQVHVSPEDMIEISGTLPSRNKFAEMFRAEASHARQRSRFERGAYLVKI